MSRVLRQSPRTAGTADPEILCQSWPAVWSPATWILNLVPQERWPPKPRAMCWTPVKTATTWASTTTLFNAHGDTNAIVSSSKHSRAWGREEPAFLFQPGSIMDRHFGFSCNDLTIKLRDGPHVPQLPQHGGHQQHGGRWWLRDQVCGLFVKSVSWLPATTRGSCLCSLCAPQSPAFL